MGWWRRAKIENFEDRNAVNATIRRLVAFAETLKYASKLIFQTARGARAMVSEVTANKVLSSFPDVVRMLEEADKIALDDPRKFADICKDAARELYNRVSELETERSEFTRGDNPARLKGLVDDEK
jgi:hypothetical protein